MNAAFALKCQRRTISVESIKPIRRLSIVVLKKYGFAYNAMRHNVLPPAAVADCGDVISKAKIKKMRKRKV